MKYIVMTLLTVIFSFSCGNSIPFEEETTLKRPVGLSADAVSGRQVQISYFIQNQEKTFDGYNLHISRATISDSEAISGRPLIIDGTAPTFKHKISEFDASNPVTVTLSTFDGIQKFETGVTYFFRMTAHSRNGSISEPSNEVSVVIIE